MTTIIISTPRFGKRIGSADAAPNLYVFPRGAAGDYYSSARLALDSMKKEYYSEACTILETVVAFLSSNNIRKCGTSAWKKPPGTRGLLQHTLSLPSPLIGFHGKSIWRTVIRRKLGGRFILMDTIRCSFSRH